MAKEQVFYGKTEEDVKSLSITDFSALITARQRRTIQRGFTDAQKRLLEKVKKVRAGKYTKKVKTHCRDMIVVPEMVGLEIQVYNGKEYIPVMVDIEKLGHYLGEFSLTRRRLVHSAPGLGASRSSTGAKK